MGTFIDSAPSIIGFLVVCVFFFLVSARLKINGTQLICSHFQGQFFYKREALIGTALAAFFRCQLFNQSGVAYTCVKCGHIHWFVYPKETDVEMTQQRE